MTDIRFQATAPDASAFVTIKGDGESRVSLLVPESEIAAMTMLAAYGRGVVLDVRVAVDDVPFTDGPQ